MMNPFVVCSGFSASEVGLHCGAHEKLIPSSGNIKLCPHCFHSSLENKGGLEMPSLLGLGRWLTWCLVSVRT